MKLLGAKLPCEVIQAYLKSIKKNPFHSILTVTCDILLLLEKQAIVSYPKEMKL
jgi:hypothetical protein